jgi:uncharacterized protein YlaI
MSLRCVLCDRSFGSDEALQQHKRDSLAHAFDCTTCDRHFSSDTALQQHLRDSPVHAPSFDCDDCDRSFDSDKALQQHLWDSLAHAPPFDCETCDRSFGSEETLGQHQRDSRAHQQIPQTPLDAFSRSFPTFDYDPSLPPATSECSPKALIRKYLLEHEPVFARLYKLQQEMRAIEFPNLNYMKMIFSVNQGVET